MPPAWASSGFPATYIDSGLDRSRAGQLSSATRVRFVDRVEGFPPALCPFKMRRSKRPPTMAPLNMGGVDSLAPLEPACSDLHATQRQQCQDGNPCAQYHLPYCHRHSYGSGEQE
jgi:hypothetical protein